VNGERKRLEKRLADGMKLSNYEPKSDCPLPLSLSPSLSTFESMTS